MKVNWWWWRKGGLDKAAHPESYDHGQARLLELTFSRLLFGIHALPFVGAPFLLWMWQQGLDVTNMLIWLAVCVLFNLWAVRLKGTFFLDLSALSALRAVDKWRPAIHRLVIVYGFGVSILALITAGKVSTGFAYLLLTVQAAIIAGNATHLSPEIGTFKRFFTVAWGICVVLIPWSFPDEWPATLFLSLIFVLAIHLQAMRSHSFFVQFVQLEESSKQLAERYRLAKEEAESALQAKNRFLSTASHDLRQPVHAMGFLIESIAHRNRDQVLVPALDDLRRSVQSATQMFNALLDLSRIETGGIEVRREPVAINPLMRDVGTVFREEARSRGLDLRVRLSRSGKAVVMADALMLRQSLVNLLHNALRYTSRGGVLICVRRRGTDWQLEVWDTGVGVANDEKAKVYSPFYRNQHAWRRDDAGHGLGLAVVARCAELMGATHGFDSIEGRGSRFWMRLPGALPQQTGVLPLPTPFPALSTLRSLTGTCLVVDDDPQVVSAWNSLMQAWGVEVRCAASAAEAFATLDAGFQPRAILCDQRLRSGESGFEVLKALFSRCPEASGAMVSGEYSSDELQEAEQEGYLVLRKPLEAAQLHALLMRWFVMSNDVAADQWFS
jgi:signal transduction histidine kinase/CheY-like chemotaxis protein